MEKIKEILTSSRAKTFYWTTGNALIVLVLSMIDDGTIQFKDAVITSVVIAGLNGLTKYINTQN